MAGTIYTYQDVLSMLDPVIHRKIIETRGATMVNLALHEVWDQYDWEDSIGKLPPFFMVPSTQDYPDSMYGIKPSDFLGFRQARFVYLGADPPVRRPMGVQKHLELTENADFPHAISYQKSFDGFRLFPRPAENMGSPNYMIEGTYKKEPPILATGSLDTNIAFGDDFLTAWLAGLKWAGFALAGDDRAGQKIQNQGVLQYSGQIADFMTNIMMKAAEYGLNDGDVSIAPSEPLVPTEYTPYGWTGGPGR